MGRAPLIPPPPFSAILVPSDEAWVKKDDVVEFRVLLLLRSAVDAFVEPGLLAMHVSDELSELTYSRCLEWHKPTRTNLVSWCISSSLEIEHSPAIARPMPDDVGEDSSLLTKHCQQHPGLHALVENTGAWLCQLSLCRGRLYHLG